MFETPSRTSSPGRTLQGTGWDYLGELEAMAGWLTTGPDSSHALAASVSGMDTFRGAETVVHWINTIASSRARARAGDSTAAGQLDDLVNGSGIAGPDTRGLASEVSARLEVIEALCCIPDNYRCALLLKEGAGMTVERTALLMGVSTASLRSILYRARRALRA